MAQLWASLYSFIMLNDMEMFGLKWELFLGRFSVQIPVLAAAHVDLVPSEFSPSYSTYSNGLS